MRHANMTAAADDPAKKYIGIKTSDGQTLYLYESEYSKEELDEFEAAKSVWIIRREGETYFYADSDSGEDARGSYCGYFDLLPENAVFDNGKLAGYYFCPGDLLYSGRGRASFWIDEWGYPGYDPFSAGFSGRAVHLFFFSKPDTHTLNEWSLIKRDPETEYKTRLSF